MSTFGYVGGDPVNTVDPDGLTAVLANDFFNPGINLPPWVGAVARRAGAAYYGVKIGSALGAPFGDWVYDVTHPSRRVSPSELPNISISELAAKDLLRPWQVSEHCGDDENVVPFPKSSAIPIPFDDDEKDKGCEALRQSILDTCASLTGMKRMRCLQEANALYQQCLEEK